MPNKTDHEKAEPIASFSVDYRDDAKTIPVIKAKEQKKRKPKNTEEQTLEEFFVERQLRPLPPEREVPREEGYEQVASKEKRQRQEKEPVTVSVPPLEESFSEEARKGKPSISKGVFFLLLALALVVSFVAFFEKDSLMPLNSAAKLKEFDSFLVPVVMQDPESFQKIEEVDPQMIMTAGIWRAILSKPDHYYDQFDDRGRTVVPFSDVDAACKELFGPSYDLPMKKPQQTFYELDTQKQEFYVVPHSNHNTYLPYTQKASRRDGNIYLLVGYVSPDDPTRTDPDSATKTPVPEKTKEFILSEQNDGFYYILSLRDV